MEPIASYNLPNRQGVYKFFVIDDKLIIEFWTDNEGQNRKIEYYSALNPFLYDYAIYGNASQKLLEILHKFNVLGGQNENRR
ncbi:hypothetical protein [Dolichospermum phage Dfl-JY23]